MFFPAEAWLPRSDQCPSLDGARRQPSTGEVKDADLGVTVGDSSAISGFCPNVPDPTSSMISPETQAVDPAPEEV